MYVSKNFLGGMLCLLLKGGREIMPTYPGAFTPDVKSMLNENLGGILGGTLGGRYPMLNEPRA
jgi:hypothetical protein